MEKAAANGRLFGRCRFRDRRDRSAAGSVLRGSNSRRTVVALVAILGVLGDRVVLQSPKHCFLARQRFPLVSVAEAFLIQRQHRHPQRQLGIAGRGRFCGWSSSSSTFDMSASPSNPSVPDDCNNSVSQDDTKQQYTKSHSLTVCLVPPPQIVTPGDGDASIAPHTEKDVRAATACEHYDERGVRRTWEVLTSLRTELKDPGLFRWPPHVNLLYPFVREKQEKTIGGGGEDEEQPLGMSTTLLAKLRKATQNVEPFWVCLDPSTDETTRTDGCGHPNNRRRGLGTFGGSNRGVLWIYPESFRNNNENNNGIETMSPVDIQGTNDDDSVTPGDGGKPQSSTFQHSPEPIVELQSFLEAEFPACVESLKQRNFFPHLTLSHYGSIDGARTAGARVVAAKQQNSTNTPSFPPLRFWCREIYVLERDGDNGQFQRRATIALGQDIKDCAITSNTEIDGVVFHDPPLAFPGMPLVEADWVREERHALKARRRQNTRGRRRRNRNHTSYKARRTEARKASKAIELASGKPLMHDTPEVIARKRAERKARREERAKINGETKPTDDE